MNDETKKHIGIIKDIATVALSGFGGGKAQIAVGLIQIVNAAQAAHLAHTGEPIDPSLIQPIDTLSLDDLPKKKK